MNLIQKLESDISQASEYGGIPNHYSRSELRQFLAVMKAGEKLEGALDEAAKELLSFGPSSKDDYYLEILINWKDSIKC
jgi:hypothetical protein